MRYIRFVKMLPLIAVLIMATSCYGTIKEQTEESKAIVEGVGQWFIEEGLAKYYQGEGVEFIRRYAKEHGAHLPTEVMIENYGYVAHLWLEDAWVNGYVTCYSRVEPDKVYEYWVLQLDATREEVPREIYFMITKSDGIDKERQVIKKSEKFFPKYNISEGPTVQFPMDNKTIYTLRPWRFPEAFKGTELEGVKVVIDDNGNYVRIKAE